VVDGQGHYGSSALSRRFGTGKRSDLGSASSGEELEEVPIPLTHNPDVAETEGYQGVVDDNEYEYDMVDDDDDDDDYDGDQIVASLPLSYSDAASDVYDDSQGVESGSNELALAATSGWKGYITVTDRKPYDIV